MGVLWAAVLTWLTASANAQQWNSDNQWTAPHGVGTVVATFGQEFSQFMGVAALLPDTEFNLGGIRFEGTPDDRTEAHYSGIAYIKRRLSENERGDAGTAVQFGTGVNPAHLSAGEITDNFQSWFASYIYTQSFFDGKVTWDLMPGVMVNLDKDQQDETAWGVTWSSRTALYGVVPKSALIAEFYGTAGEAFAEPTYRVGVRWESPKLIVAATYGDTFDREGSPRFELGFLYLTDVHRLFCLGGGCTQ